VARRARPVLGITSNHALRSLAEGAQMRRRENRMSDTAKDFIRREVGNLLRVVYRDMVGCSLCFFKPMIARFGTAQYTRGQAERSLDASFRSPGALRRIHRFVCDQCGKTLPCLTATPARSGLSA